MQLFCLKCNGATDYSSSKPLYCSKCGKPYSDISHSNLNKSIQVANRPLKRPSRQIEAEETYKEEDDYIAPESIPQIDKFECEIERNLRPNREHLQSLAGKGEIGIRRPKPKGKSKNLSPKQIEKSWTAQFPKNKRHDDGE
jgi:hypothetical protein